MPSVAIHVFGWGKRHHGIHRCWILVMVPIDVTNLMTVFGVEMY
jgi:hypothetical protein